MILRLLVAGFLTSGLFGRDVFRGDLGESRGVEGQSSCSERLLSPKMKQSDERMCLVFIIYNLIGLLNQDYPKKQNFARIIFVILFRLQSSNLGNNNSHKTIMRKIIIFLVANITFYVINNQKYQHKGDF